MRRQRPWISATRGSASPLLKPSTPGWGSVGRGSTTIAWRWVLGALLALGLVTGCRWTVQPAETSNSSYREPLVPTPLPDSPPTPTPPPSMLADMPAAPAPALPAPYTLRWRMGAAVPDGRSPAELAWPTMRPGWYLNWSVGYTATVAGGSIVVAAEAPPPLTAADLVVPPDAAIGMEFAPLVWVDGAELRPSPAWLAATAAALPGKTWLIGNEPDVKWQGNSTPEEYARAYHLAYTTLKAADPTAQVAIGGISQVTPLRLAYLDAVLDAYTRQFGAEMPVDVWNIHVFVLQEKADDWGVDIPPGLTARAGELWTIEDHDDLALVEAQIWRMRRWLADKGRGNLPLWITEYGILMPAAYGFDAERVRRFMLGSFDLFLSLRDPVLGYAPDDHRLVQRWMWFSTGYDLYPTGDLFTPDGRPTTLLDTMTAYLAEYGPD